MVSSEKAEKVVKPPRMPVIRKGARRLPDLLGQHDDQQAHEEGAGDVHGQRADGKAGAEQAAGGDVDQIARAGADGAAGGNLCECGKA